MKRIGLIVLLASCLAAAAGCSGDRKAKELFETAQFEEKQNNREHATRLYEEIVRTYPGSDLARKAEARLADLKAAKP